MSEVLNNRRLVHALSQLLVGIDSDVFDNGASEPLKSIGMRVRQAPIDSRRGVLLGELGQIPSIDAKQFMAALGECDPTRPFVDGVAEDYSPVPLPAPIPFPVEALPSGIRAYVSEAAESIGCPVDYIAVPVLSCMGAAIGTSVKLEIKPGWGEFPSLYVAVVAPSGSKKTPALEAAARFTIAHGTEQTLDYKQALERYEIEVAQYGAIKEQRKRATTKDERPALPDKPVKPTLKRAWLSDATVEAVARRLQETPRGMILIRDELSSLPLGMNQYRGGRGADLQFFLQVWSSYPVAVDRKQDDEPLILNQPFLGIAGGIQPVLLVKVFGGERLYDGFTARFLFCDPPLMPHKSSNAVISDDAIRHAESTFASLYRICPAQPYAPIPVPQLVRLSAEARTLFAAWENQIGDEIDSMSPEDPFRAPLSKIAGQLGRIALILHVAKYASGVDGCALDLTDETMINAMKIADYFLAHARRVWRRLIESADDTQMRQVINWMERKQTPVTPRDLVRSGVPGFKSSKEAQSLLDRMVEFGLVDKQPFGRTIRYSLRARVSQ